MDVIYSYRTVKIIPIDDIRDKKKLLESPNNGISKSKSYTSMHDMEKREIKNTTFIRHVNTDTNGWYYMTIAFKEYQYAVEFYKKIIGFMISFTNMNDSLKYCTTFQVVPVIIVHTNGNYYIVVRIRIHNEIIPEVYNIIVNVIYVFNDKFKDTMHMTRELGDKNIKYFQWLYVKEYMPYFKKKNQPKEIKSSIINNLKSDIDVKYASISVEKQPPMPPMPKFLTIPVIPTSHEEHMNLDSSYNTTQYSAFQLAHY